MPVEAPNILVTIFAFLILIGTLVVVHELGHYFVGRWFGVKAEKFSIGFGPQIWGRVDKRGTLWRIAALPLGGYVQFAGDMNPTSQADEGWKSLPEVERNQTFQSKSLLKRALIVFAGPAVNFLLAIAILTGFTYIYGRIENPAIVESVAPGSAAEKIGLKHGDRIVSVNDATINNFEDLINEMVLYPDQDVVLVIERDGKKFVQPAHVQELKIQDRFGNEMRRGMLGLPMPKPEIRPVGLLEAPVVAVSQTWTMIRHTVIGLGQIIRGERSVKELGGPLKIAKISGERFSLGPTEFIWLAALVSINLGFINLLPIPMLDGGHLLLYAIEAVRRRPTTPRVQEWAFRAGFIMLAGFMLMVTFNDLASFGLFGS